MGTKTKKPTKPAVERKPVSLLKKAKRYKNSHDWMCSDPGMELFGAFDYVLSQYGFTNDDIDRALPLIANTLWMFIKY